MKIRLLLLLLFLSLGASCWAITGSTYSFVQLSLGGDVIDAREYSVDPTGVTDSTAAIQAALDAAFVSTYTTKTVVLPDGLYPLTSRLNVWSGVTLRGLGAATLRRTKFVTNADPNTNFTMISLKYGGTVENLILDGNRDNATPTVLTSSVAPCAANYADISILASTTWIGPSGSTQVTGDSTLVATKQTVVRGCKIYNSCGSAIRGDPGRRLLVEDCDIQDFGDHAVYVFGSLASPTVDCVFRDIRVFKPAWVSGNKYNNGAFKFSNYCVGQNVVTDCVIYEDTSDGDNQSPPFQVYSGYSVAGEAGSCVVDFIGNSSTEYYGLQVTAIASAASVRFMNNVVTAIFPFRVGYTTATSSQCFGSVTISGNTFRIPSGSAQYGYVTSAGVATEALTCYLTNNTFISPISIGISDGISKLVVAANTFYGIDGTWPIVKSANVNQNGNPGYLAITNNAFIGCDGIFYEVSSTTNHLALTSYSPLIAGNSVIGDQSNYILYSAGTASGSYTGTNTYTLVRNYCQVENNVDPYLIGSSSYITDLNNVIYPYANIADTATDTGIVTEVNKIKAMLRNLDLMK